MRVESPEQPRARQQIISMIFLYRFDANSAAFEQVEPFLIQLCFIFFLYPFYTIR